MRKHRIAYQWVAPVTLAISLLGAGLVLALPARAQLQQLACLIPGLGIRSCSAPGLEAASPVSVSRDGATLTVAALLSSGGHTILRLDISVLQSPVGQLPPGRLPLTLRDSTGRAYAPEDGWAEWVRPEDPRGLSATATFAALDSSVRAVDVHLEGPQPIGAWTVRVPVAPVDPAKLPLAREGPPGVTVEGITVRIANIVIDASGTTVQLTAQSHVQGRGVANLANHQPLVHPLVLRDDKGREYQEQSRPLEALPRSEGIFTEDVSFPPLAQDARSVSLSVPFVTAVEETDPTTIRVPIAGKAVGDHIALNAAYKLGPYPFRLIGADLVTQPPGPPPALTSQFGDSWLTLQLDYGDWSGGRKLVGPGVVENSHAIQSSPQGDVSQFTRVSVPLVGQAGSEATITFQNAHVAIEGPWQLEAPLPGGH